MQCGDLTMKKEQTNSKVPLSYLSTAAELDRSFLQLGFECFKTNSPLDCQGQVIGSWLVSWNFLEPFTITTTSKRVWLLALASSCPVAMGVVSYITYQTYIHANKKWYTRTSIMSPDVS